MTNLRRFSFKVAALTTSKVLFLIAGLLNAEIHARAVCSLFTSPEIYHLPRKQYHPLILIPYIPRVG
jgi:hypothetical protein